MVGKRNVRVLRIVEIWWINYLKYDEIIWGVDSGPKLVTSL